MQIDNPTAARQAFIRRMEQDVASPVQLEWKRYRRTMISLRPRLPHGWVVRLHPDFAYASEEVVGSLCRYLNTRRRSDWKEVRQYALTIAETTPTEKPPAEALRTHGIHHDLHSYHHAVTKEFFEGTVHADITWNPHRGHPGKRRRSICFGHFDRSQGVIRIHPALDDSRVEGRFIEYIIYHETLHAVFPPILRNGRCFAHHPAFRAQECKFPDFQRMKMLSKRYLRLLKK